MKVLKKLTIITLVIINSLFAHEILVSATTTLDLICFAEGFYNPTTDQMSKPIPVTVVLHKFDNIFNISVGTGVLSINGFASISIDIPENGDYYIEIKNWHMIQTWSMLPVGFTIGGTTSYDFSIDNMVYGWNAKQIDYSPLRWGIYVGDVNQDSIVTDSDLNIVYSDSYSYASGNITTDLTGDEITDVDDLIISDNNRYNNIGFIKP